jgi:hypothetical protein
MNSHRHFVYVYRLIETLYHREVVEREMERSYRSYLKVTGLEPQP